MADPRDHESPAGAPPERKDVDKPWRVGAAVIVVAAIAVGGLLGFVIIPAGQKENAGLSMGHAMSRAAGLEPGSPAEKQPLSTATSTPVSQVSWDPQIMKILAAGNTKRGATLAAKTCVACHGEEGISQTIFPSLAGQTSYAIYKQLYDFRTGARANPQMTPVAKALSVSDLAAVAAYYAEASKKYAALGTREYVGEGNIDALAR